MVQVVIGCRKEHEHVARYRRCDDSETGLKMETTDKSCRKAFADNVLMTIS